MISISTNQRISSFFWGRTVLANNVKAPWGRDTLKIGIALGDELDAHPVYETEVFRSVNNVPHPEGGLVMQELIIPVDRDTLKEYEIATGVNFDRLEDEFIAKLYELKTWLVATGRVKI